ncbi:hypothetical protein [Roseovarius rhodophyticola]|uniref:Uncharacterized protein n=1 Tax=Roseovarius rhodophyticola TaxID=3080827 RepID=A0ABZ2TJN0_9RHOB|nr:hypothetical protein [Roseovarius sp. W115]MDV2928560.1 hypothetical protein [Roseovarius sp. W115]
MNLEKYKLHPSLVVPIDKNTIPRDGLKVSFVTGAAGGETCTVSKLNSLWTFFCLAANVSKDMLVAIEYAQANLSLLVYKEEGDFWAFSDPGDNTLRLIGEYSDLGSQYVSVYEPRWNYAYFLPKDARLSFCQLIKAINSVLDAQSFGKTKVCEQTSEEIMALYLEMERHGRFD